MEKRALAAIGLSALILLVWTIFFAPKPPAPPPASPARTIPGAAASSGEAPESGSPTGPPAAGSSLPDTSPASNARVAAARREAPEGAPPVIIETAFERIELRNPGA